MNTEYEVRVLNIDRQKMILKLEELNATFMWEQFQKRYVYDFIPVQKGKWIRLRTNGNKTTLTIKEIINDKIDGTKELEIEVSDFEETNKILEKLGYKPKGYQENKRCQYILDGVEIDIDSWPLIPEYMEIEGKSKEEVYTIVEKLGLSKKDITTRDVEGIYLDYGHNLKEIYNLKFEEEEI